MSINEKLIELYKNNLKGIGDVSEFSMVPDENKKIYSSLLGPQLMHCWENEYRSCKFKILFIGQEVSEGNEAFDNINIPLEEYRKFALAEQYNSVFWQKVKLFNRLLNSDTAGKCFQWTNVSKYATWKGKSLDFDTHKFIVSKMNILEDEINIL